jgi:hypothetical protein
MASPEKPAPITITLVIGRFSKEVMIQGRDEDSSRRAHTLLWWVIPLSKVKFISFVT